MSFTTILTVTIMIVTILFAGIGVWGALNVRKHIERIEGTGEREKLWAQYWMMISSVAYALAGTMVGVIIAIGLAVS